MTLEYVAATMDDYEMVQSSMLEAFEDISEKYLGHRNLLPPGFADGSFLKEKIPTGEIVKVVKGEDLVGGFYIVPYKDSTSDLELKALWVDVNHQNKGYGSKIWQYIEENYETDTWWLETPKVTTSTHHFYEKLGFEQVRENKYGNVTLILYKKKM